MENTQPEETQKQKVLQYLKEIVNPSNEELENLEKVSELKNKRLLLPVVSTGAEYLVMGYLMRRNILTFKAPDCNDGYDLISIHPDPRHQLKKNEFSQIRIQVKSRYQIDCDRGFPVKERTLDAFDYLVVVFLNIGKFFNKNDGLSDMKDVEFYTLPAEVVKKHHNKSGVWQKVMSGKIEDIEQYKNELGFEQIAAKLGVERPQK